MAELPEFVSKGQLAAAIVLVLLGFLAIVFAGGSAAIIWLGALLVLAGGIIGTLLGLKVWRETE